MILSSTSQSITAILSGAATPAPTFLAGYHDPRTAGVIGTNAGTLSDTAATIVAGTSSATVVDFINIYNADNANITVTVTFVSGSNSYGICLATLASGDTLSWTLAGGWKTVNSVGQLKNSGASFTQGAALTAQLSTISIADAAGTPDYALQALTTSSPYGLATAQEAISVLYVIKNLQTRVAEMEVALEGAGIVAAN